MANDREAPDERLGHAAAQAADPQVAPARLDLPDDGPEWPGDTGPTAPTEEPALPGEEDVNPDSPPGQDDDREQQGPDPSQYPDSLPPSHYEDN